MYRKLATTALAVTVGVGLAACGSSGGGTSTAGGGATGGTSGSAAPTTSSGSDTSSSPSSGGGGGTGLMEIITVDPSNPYWKAEVDTAVKVATGLGYTTNVDAHLNDPTKQTQFIDAAISKQAKAIILDPAGAQESVGAVQKATAAGIPVFLVNAEIDKQGIAKAQIVSNNAQGAVLGAQEFVKQVPKGKYVELYGQPTDNNAKVRSDGYAQVLSQYPDLEKVGQETANWDRAQGKTKMETLLRAHPDIVGVVSGNDEMALGAISAIKDAGKTSQIKVLGFDGSQDAVNAVKAGTMIATVLQPIVEGTTDAVKEADQFLKTGSTGASAEKQALDCTLITKDNAANFRNFVPLS